MLHLLLQIATIYTVAILGLVIGIGISSDVLRWLQDRKESSQCGAQGRRVGGGHV